jgi:hypothetical protein
MRQFVGLAGRQRRRPPAPRCRRSRRPWCHSRHESAKRLTSTPSRWSGVFLAAPAAFWWARMEVPSRKAMPSSTPRFCAMASSRSHTPSRDRRMKVCAAIHQGPNSSGRERHLAPFWCRQKMAPIVRRRLLDGTFAGGRHASTIGSSTAHCSSVSTSTAPQKDGSTPATASRSGANRA